MSEAETKLSDFDIKAFRGHARIAYDHLENAVREFEVLQSAYRKLLAENKELKAAIEAAGVKG